jgi:hypothetical protein
MPGPTLSSLSTQYVQVPVRVSYQGQPYNPTALPAYMSFADGSGTPSAWNNGSWAWTTAAFGYYLVQCLVGPSGTIALESGAYTVWVKIGGSGAVPVTRTGTLTIT